MRYDVGLNSNAASIDVVLFLLVRPMKSSQSNQRANDSIFMLF
jgi:hypothetical protein